MPDSPQPCSPLPTEPASVPTPSASPAAGKRFLERMLDRLFAALVNGPGINCRPNRSRQRIDWAQLSTMNDLAPAEALAELLGPKRQVILRARKGKKSSSASTQTQHDEEPLTDQPTDQLALQSAEHQTTSTPPKDQAHATAIPVDRAGLATVANDEDEFRPETGAGESPTAAVSPEETKPDGNAGRGRRFGSRAERDPQETLLQKLHIIADDAKTYEQDTGVTVLNIGFPLLSLPPAAAAPGQRAGRRILAPVAYIPVALSLRRGATRSVEIACQAEGVDLVQPNTALLAYLQRQTGKPIAELFADEKGEDPWREIQDLVRQVCEMVDLDVPEAFRVTIEAASSAAGAPTGGSPAKAGLIKNATHNEPRETEPQQTNPLADTCDTSVNEVVKSVSKPEPEPKSSPPLSVVAGQKSDDQAGPVGLASAGKGTGGTAGPLSVPTLELRAAPTSEEASAGAEIVLSAVLGLFPVANQGLLRDLQELAENPGSITGPLARFVKLGSLLDAPAAPSAAEPSQQPVSPVNKALKTFADERLITDADPCQARAVRLARQSPALVVHGPPGTGKSQTIANIIGDHLARGQKVLFVCEKRTAIDVVANRLDHMGLGDLVGVVHDPQRDQRDLYRKIRDHLERLGELKTDARAANKLRQVDEELQALHVELSDYRIALSRIDVESGHSFHELMGHWLAASPPEIVGGTSAKSPLSLDLKSAAELAKVRLKELSPLEHPLSEMYSRGARIGYATNPWTSAVGISLPALLGRPVQQNAGAIDAILAAALTVDQSALDREPFIPPFSAGVDLTAQGAGRVALAGQVEQMLTQTPPDVLDRWAQKSLPELRLAKQKLTESLPYQSAMAAVKLDPTLLARWRQAVGEDLPAVRDLTEQRKVVERYLASAEMSLEWVERIGRASPQATWAVIARWVSTEMSLASAVLSRMQSVAPLAERAASAPLDPELLAQYRRQPFDLSQLLRWQSAIDNYLPIGDKFLSFLYGAKKKAAAPVLEYFGLGLTVPSATRVRDFLSGLRARLEVWDVVKRETVTAKPGGSISTSSEQPTALPDDTDLLPAYLGNLQVLKAAADLHRPTLPTAASAADATMLVNVMVSEELVLAEPIQSLFGLTPTSENARRAIAMIDGLVVRVILQQLNQDVLSAPTPDGLMDDHDLEISLRGHTALFDLALSAGSEPATQDVWPVVAGALVQRDRLQPTLAGLRASPKRAADILSAEAAVADAGLFSATWSSSIDLLLRQGNSLTPTILRLHERLDTLEDVVRVKDALEKTSPAVRPAAAELLSRSATPTEAWDVLRRDVVAGEIRRRLAADPKLQTIDGHRLSSSFDRYRDLAGKKRQLVRDVILDEWIQRQKDRLLSENGERLSSLGAELRRRLLLRGEKAIRLRQVIARGSKISGGDPLFDICPVWMVSPETAAQVFPCEAMFDVVVFDEASQCRLEEAVPVLVRGKRVVIAGDPRQLPPTRFFETAFAASEDDDEPTDEQGWFEQQQGEVEDLLTASLGLDAQQSYLDVHYRSRNSDLIEFSNEHFYNSRLQAIPGHPSRRAKLPPIRLHRVNGIYQKRRNEAEADAVVELVKELLGRKEPPSIGIACFNMVQRDLIVERLDDAATEDAKFAKRLAAARERIGAGSFEGLFVKNLENVQGDERDHLIISTTYGPEPTGKFYRRFGPLAMPGGGRRLNVLVTRAREEVHLVTSIPEEIYRTTPDLPPGQLPGGGWLLFAYLRYADELSRAYAIEANRAKPQAAADVLTGSEASTTEEKTEPSTVLDDEVVQGQPVIVGKTRAPSSFSEALAQKISGKPQSPTEVYWGNDGFCVDLVVNGGKEPLGILCDAARFGPADDLTEWDVFRTGILESQGWKLHRVWTPHFFRDPKGRAAAITASTDR